MDPHSIAPKKNHHHQSLNHEGHWGTTDDFATSFIHFSLFSTALWDLRELQACPFPYVVFPSLPLSALSSSPFLRALQDGFGLMNGRHDHTTAVCVSLRSSGGFRVSSCLLDLGTDFLVGNMVFV